MQKTAIVFLVSDGTGITVESFTNSLLSQFPNINFKFHAFPYTDTNEKVQAIVKKIEDYAQRTQQRPIVFSTIIDQTMLKPLFECSAEVFDLFNPMIDRLEHILETNAIDEAGRAHGFTSPSQYDQRIDAINYALNCDDGLGCKNYQRSDVILIGVSRCGKTPSCLYMALQFGIYAANFPITEEYLDSHQLPKLLEEFKPRLFGLTISAQRLQQIRHERRPHSKYASLEQCQYEINHVENLYQQHQIPYLDSTFYSIEEISTRIISQLNLKKRL